MVQILAFGNVRSKIETGIFPVFTLWQVWTDEIAKNTKRKTLNKMKMTLNTYQIADALKNDTCARWSYNGSLALAEYLEEYEESTGEEMELDVCAIRCDFSEYASLQDWAENYFDENWREDIGVDEGGEGDSEEEEEKIRFFIQDRGQLIEFDGGVIVSQF